jgi:pyrroloquinoline quinone biosynthesis protein B
MNRNDLMDITPSSQFAVVLGIAQDGGYPQPGCVSQCCVSFEETGSIRRMPSCMGLIDRAENRRFMLDCTPQFSEQMTGFMRTSPNTPLSGILLTHAHMGHYAGLVYLGKEAMCTHKLPLYTMPKMANFLSNNEPYASLIRNNNVVLVSISNGAPITLTSRITVTPYLVPHRGEYSETVCFLVQGPNQAILYLPDIDGWNAWSEQMEQLIKQVCWAYVDGTFYDAKECPERNVAKIPHPTVSQTMDTFKHLGTAEREKIRFGHLNHTNPLLIKESPASSAVLEAGYNLAREGEFIRL